MAEHRESFVAALIGLQLAVPATTLGLLLAFRHASPAAVDEPAGPIRAEGISIGGIIATVIEADPVLDHVEALPMIVAFSLCVARSNALQDLRLFAEVAECFSQIHLVSLLVICD